MEAIKFSINTIIFLMIFIVPGGIFNFIISKWTFKNGSYANNRIASFLLSIITSLLLILIVENTAMKDLFNRLNLKNCNEFSQTTECHVINNLKSKNLFETAVYNLSEAEPQKKVDNTTKDAKVDTNIIYFLLVGGGILIAASIVLSSILSLVLFFIDRIITSPYLFSLVFYLFYFDKTLMSKLYFEIIEFDFSEIILPRYHSLLNKEGKKWFNRLFSILILFILLILILIIILILSIGVVANLFLQYTLYKILNLLRHNFHEKFFRFNLFPTIPVVEIRTTDNQLIKGVFHNFSPLNHEEIYSISLINVAKYYSSAIQSEVKITSNSSRFYRFPNPESELTIVFKEIKDFNFWHLRNDSYEWKKDIKDEDDLKNYVWHIELLIKKNKLNFNNSHLMVRTSRKLYFKLVHRLINLIEEEYRPRGIKNFILFSNTILIHKKRELYARIINNTRKIVKEIQQSGISQNEFLKVSEQYNKLLERIRTNSN